MIIKNQKLKFASITSSILLVSFVFAGHAHASQITVGNVVQLINQARDGQGLAELTENDQLDKVAEDKLSDMIANSYFAHTSPAGVSPWSWFQKENYDYTYAGENLAINFTKAQDEQTAWMNSPLHRQNILNTNYQEIGAAVGAGKIDGQMSLVVVTEFGNRDGIVLNTSQKNFSGTSNTNLVKDARKIPPAVLSVKDTTGPNNSISSGSGQNSFGQSFENAWNKDGGNIINYSSMSIWLLLIAIAILTPAIIISLVFSHALSVGRSARRIAVKFKDNINEIKLVKIHMA